MSRLRSFSVAMPCFNAETTIEAALLSLIQQSYKGPLEILIQDGASTDSTLERVTELKKRTPAQLSILIDSSPDEGMYSALNRAFGRAQGEVLTWLNADDLLSPWTLQTINDVFDSDPQAHWLCGYPARANAVGSLFDMNEVYYFQSDLKAGRCDGTFRPLVQQEGTFWTRALWNKSGARLDTRYKLAADFELWTRMAAHSELALIRSVLGIFRLTGQQKTHRIDADGNVKASLSTYIEEVNSIKKNLGTHDPPRPSDEALKYQWNGKSWEALRIERKQLEPQSASRRLMAKLRGAVDGF